ncbi:hypothetical protein C8Q73DRAFT_662222 [Cubamyces lactineus]|nr:hypothetical protein C8Q73DRAFT_662222 [Cubamyces lactineus]
MVNARAFVLFYVCAVAHAASLHGAGGSDVRTSGRVDIDMHSAQGNSGVAHTALQKPPLPSKTSEPDVTTEAATVYYTISEPVGGFRGVESSAAYSDLPVFPTSSFDPATSVTPRPGAVDPSLPPDASTIRVSASPSSTLEPASTSSTEDHDRNATYTRALIIVIVVQAVLLLALIVTLIVVLVRRRNASRMAREHRYVKIIPAMQLSLTSHGQSEKHRLLNIFTSREALRVEDVLLTKRDSVYM